jgi:hypothetical protein
LFSGCIRASLAKAYEFSVEAHTEREGRASFFLVPTLRSICEDLIYLAYMGQMSKSDRESLAYLMMQWEVVARLADQVAFFKAARPEQPIVGPGVSNKTQIEDSIREIWKRNGWPKLTNAHSPQTRQIAEKYDPELLATLYDFLYRLTSGVVHFNPHVHLRSGWGKLPDIHFSPLNFEDYYRDCARTYSVFLLCMYFELFARFLQPGRSVQDLVAKMRQDVVGKLRWPEMVTHEELNRAPPRGTEIVRMLIRSSDAERRKRGFFLKQRRPK